MILLYCEPVKDLRENVSVKFSLTKSELLLTLTASLAWGFFNAGYVVYLSFSPLVLMSSGHSAIAASSIVCAASWVMIFSGAICGFISDKTKRPNLIIYICMGACTLSFFNVIKFAIPSYFSPNFWISRDGPCGNIDGIVCGGNAC